jgi:hypothetical protein
MNSHGELRFYPEPPNLRVRAKRQNYLFARISAKAFIPIYDKSVEFVRKRFKKDAITRLHSKIDNEAYEYFTREIALHWMYYYNVNGLKIRVTRDDLTHPQTCQIAMHLSEEVTKSAAESHRIAASIMGLSVTAYERWLKGHLAWVNGM